MKIEFDIPGCGTDWKIAYPLSIWVHENFPTAKFSYRGMHSDKGFIEFEKEEDITMFKLGCPYKWI